MAPRTGIAVGAGRRTIAIKGYAATEVGDVYKHARVLCDRLDDVEQLIRVASGQVSFHIVRAEMLAARRIAECFLHGAETTGTPEAKFTAHQLMGMNCSIKASSSPRASTWKPRLWNTRRACRRPMCRRDGARRIPASQASQYRAGSRSHFAFWAVTAMAGAVRAGSHRGPALTAATGSRSLAANGWPSAAA